MDEALPIIGKTHVVDIIGHVHGVPAKIDTGADSSSIWVSNISIDTSGILHFTLFGEGSDFYTGEVISREDYKVAQVASSSGHLQIRYRTHLTVQIGDKKIHTLFNLSDRSRNKYPILIGRRTLSGKFMVDVRQGLKVEKRFNTLRLNKELRDNPHAFFQKYHQSTYNNDKED